MRIFYIFFIVLATSCAGSKKTQTALVANADDSISLKRSACYGTCPVYSLTIFGDGRIAYEGVNHVDLVGNYTGQLEVSKVNTLYGYIRSLKWESYPERYPMDNYDFPQFAISYKTAEIDKSIKANTNASPELIGLSDYLDELVYEANLVKE